MKLRISRWVFLAVIVSSFFIIMYGRHVGGPLVLFEFFMIADIFSILQRNDFVLFLPFLAVIAGQLLFLFLGLRTLTGYKLWLLLISPLLVTVPLIYMLSFLTTFQKETTISAIPFLVMVVVFYVDCYIKLKKNKS